MASFVHCSVRSITSPVRNDPAFARTMVGPSAFLLYKLYTFPRRAIRRDCIKRAGRLPDILQAVRPLFLRTLCVDSMHSRENCHRPAEYSTRQEINCVIPLPTNRDRCWARGRFPGPGDGTDWPTKERGRVPSSSSFSLGASACQWICSSSEHVRCWANIDTAIISIAEDRPTHAHGIRPIL